MLDTKKTSVASAALILMISNIISRIIGCVRVILIPNKLGTDFVGDAFNVAFLVPDLMYNLLLGGALAAALIPVLSGYVEQKEEKEGWQVVGTFMNVMFLAMATFSLIGLFFTPQILPLVADNFLKQSTETRELAIELTRILFPSVSFLMLAGLCNGVLNSYHKFKAAAFGPIIYNIGCISSLYFLGASNYDGAVKVAYGFMASSFIYFLFQFFSAIRKLKYYRPKIFLFKPGFIKMLKLAIPSLISSTVYQLNIIVLARYVTYTAIGGMTLFNTANRTWQLPLGIFAQSMGVAVLPALSAKFTVNNTEGYRKLLIQGLKSILFFSVPSAFAFAVISQPIVRALFKLTNNFSEQDVGRMSEILMFFSAALIAQSIVLITIRAFYAAKNTLIPLIIGASTIFVNGILGYIFLNHTSLGVSGMAFAYSISSAFHALGLIIILNSKICKIVDKDIVKFFIKIIFSSTVMAMGLLLIKEYLPVNIESKTNQILNLLILVITGTGIFFLMTHILKVEEVKSFINKALKRLKKQKQNGE